MHGGYLPRGLEGATCPSLPPPTSSPADRPSPEITGTATCSGSEAAQLLTLDQRFWGLRTDSRVSVSMQKPPDAVLQSIHAGHAKRDIAQIRAPAHLGFVALDLQRVGEIWSDEPLDR